MRRSKNIMTLCMGALLLLCAGAGAQQTPSPQPPLLAGRTQSPSKREKPAKPKKWQGKLVDADCMVKMMNFLAVPGTNHSLPHFTSSSTGPAQYPGDMRQPQEPDIQRGPYDSMHPNGPLLEPGERAGRHRMERVEMRRAARVDDAAKKCAATPSTSKFGLTLVNGQIIDFGGKGNGLASQAIKDAELRPGKPLKVIVRGFEREDGSLQVASVEIKGKHRR